MKTQIKLNSMVPNGVGSGPESGAIDLIYEILLDEYKQHNYSYIGINQIDNTLDELVMKEPSQKIFVNIRYPVYEDFDKKRVEEKNKIRLDVVHTALLRVAQYEQGLDINALEVIRQKILENNFLFNFPLKNYVSKKDPSTEATLFVSPEIDRFNYIVSVQQNQKEKCRILIYSGETNSFYIDYFFQNGRWKNSNELIVTGKKKEVEIHVFVEDCTVEFVTLTSYDAPPLFEMFKANVSPRK